MSETKAVLGERMRQSYSSWPERLGEAAGWGGELMTWKWERGLAAAGKREEELPCSPKGSSEPGGWGVRLRERGCSFSPSRRLTSSAATSAGLGAAVPGVDYSGPGLPACCCYLGGREPRFLIGKPGSERQREQVLT